MGQRARKKTSARRAPVLFAAVGLIASAGVVSAPAAPAAQADEGDKTAVIGPTLDFFGFGAEVGAHLTCGVISARGWLVGFVFFADFVPPPSPDQSADEIARIFQDNTNGIRFGMLLTLFVSPFYASWAASLAAQMKRIRGTHPVMGDLQLVLGGLTVLVFMIPALLLEVAAFRVDRDPGTIQALDDIAWLMFIAMGGVAILQPFVVGVVILQQRAEDEQVFPRWAGYLSVWTAILFLPGPVCVFFKTGPMAWDGLLPWWIPFVVFALWVVVMIGVVHRSIGRNHTARTSIGRLDPELRKEIDELIDAKVRSADASDAARPGSRSGGEPRG